MESKSDSSEVLEVLDRVLSAALREVRSIRARTPVQGASAPPPPASGGSVSTSQTALCIDVLTAAGRPLHANALLDALAARGVRTTRESLVSALTKKLAPAGAFVRTGRNTFGLAGRDAVEG